MPFATIASGTKLYYERIGSGPPLLLIMGTGLDHSVWDAQVEAYRNEFECIVFDNAGTGKSGRPDERLTVRSMAADTAGLLEALGIERAARLRRVAWLVHCPGTDSGSTRHGRSRSSFTGRGRGPMGTPGGSSARRFD